MRGQCHQPARRPRRDRIPHRTRHHRNPRRTLTAELSDGSGRLRCTVHSIYRAGLDELLGEYGIELTEASREELTASWRELAPWPDTVPGLHRLREHFVLATLSNADVSSVVNITARGDLPWHAVFTAEMVGAFKPDPACYLLAARYLGLAPDRIMMVASHKYDIRAAASLGLRTAFVARPREFGDPALADTEFSDEFDINARDFLDLADQLGA
ncbi:haloacid dehalogenase type II [Nocardia panacis]|uniref:Haloacid dehalogenase type II n=1 Tax=Nocardia panacis TaxID=2340916 RepID=A0A3A4KT71_9NOCA|nr:haloacid dehalogenase type II [Nocardia panacis]